MYQHLDDEDDDDLFFDSRDDISSSSNSCPGSPSNNGSLPEQCISNLAILDPWIKDPESVIVRRENFMRLMGLDLTRSSSLVRVNTVVERKVEEEIEPELDRISSDYGAELDSSSTENKYSMSSWSSETTSTSYEGLSEDSFIYSIKNLDDGTVFVFDEVSKDGALTSLRETGSNKTLSANEFEKNFGSSSLVLQLMRRDSSGSSNSEKSIKKTKAGWLRRLGAAVHIVDRHKLENNSVSDSSKDGSSYSGRVKVRPYKKQSKELSAIFKGQNIKAHEGSILTMKFSPDGQYLATGGEDSVIRIWHVLQCEGTNNIGNVQYDPSCIYFTVNHNSELVPLHTDGEKKKPIGTKKIHDSACVVLPPKVFRLSEDPIHEFHGHDGDVLDLSWSNNKFLLSSSMDKTVRMWQVGSECCLKVFSHKNYVTCVQFNPINENYFVSGSIDGKVRIWDIPVCHVVDWVDVNEIVTAICYQPDGKGVVVGTLTGNCRFYDASDNHLELEEQLSIQGKKKSLLRRITGFQFCPTDARKLMVTSADSQIRILDRFDVIAKYKGLQNAGSQISASFTADGRHIISASEDSNVYVWNHVSNNSPVSTNVTSTWSSERFFSSNTSVAIPWHGMRYGIPCFGTSQHLHSQQNTSNNENEIVCYSNIRTEDSFGSDTLYSSPSGCFILSHDFFSDILPRGSATWPEEKLASNANTSSLRKSHYKFLKNSCQSTSHAWGQVIVTAGWDGWIRSYQNYGLPVHI